MILAEAGRACCFVSDHDSLRSHLFPLSVSLASDYIMDLDCLDANHCTATASNIQGSSNVLIYN